MRAATRGISENNFRESSCAAIHEDYVISDSAKNQNDDFSTLAGRSPKDKPWDAHRAQADDVSAIYHTAEEFETYAQRMNACSGLLKFGRRVNTDTGEIGLTLREAQFCRVRHCPVCQWRRSLMWQARFYQALPKIIEQHPESRWLFLTLTVRNCEITELGETLKAMNAAWGRLVKLTAFNKVRGWLRTTEVTRGNDGTAHPHFHVLLMVPPSYFSGKNYVSHEDWVTAWRDSMRIKYDPNVDIRTVKAKGKGETDKVEFLRGAVAETLKYSVKPSDMTDDPQWFLELTRQVHRKRFLASGGALKDVLKSEEEITDEDLAGLTEAESDGDGSRIAFAWANQKRQYRHAPKYDKG